MFMATRAACGAPHGCGGTANRSARRCADATPGSAVAFIPRGGDPVQPGSDSGLSGYPDLFGHFPQPGTVEWIGVRPQRRGRPVSVREVRAIEDMGLAGEHYGGGAS